MKRFVALASCLALQGFAVYGQGGFQCPDEFEGFYPHHSSCDKYWECVEGEATLELCGNGLGFADTDSTYTTKNCDYLSNVDCGNRTEIEPAISAPNCPRLYGTFEDPEDCAGFFQCRDGLANRFSCAPGLAYDVRAQVCKWADQVDRCKKIEEEEEGAFQCPLDFRAGTFSKHAHPEDCRQYYVCIGGIPREYGCPLGTVFKISEGDSQYEGQCADPEDVPECSNYYGELQFDKQELVRSGADPNAVGAKVVTNRPRVNRPSRLRPSQNIPQSPVSEPLGDLVETAKEEKESVVPLPRPAPRPVVDTNSFRSSRPRPRARPAPEPVQAAPSFPEPVPQRPAPIPNRNRPRVQPPAPINSPNPFSQVPVVTPRVEVPAIPLASLTTEAPQSFIPSAVPATGKPGSLGTPAKVKAGEDYYYYYYYYDEDYPEEGGDSDAPAAAAAAAAAAA
ncbi:hypothetical protein TCAL_16939 [Tigriopus californicus]|uniref:Chitin-binding type-2 domain-containing protein n=1 Tax=Tigriopus californicus TaxID=6832 RepID=A0A553NQY2_TIGCA|nr:uncharacterized protein LOC131879861 [Tigriopus californicus]TRY67858.1 hypothetical protein TCAL_16939 [Tigriopus californicus]